MKLTIDIPDTHNLDIQSLLNDYAKVAISKCRALAYLDTDYINQINEGMSMPYSKAYSKGIALNFCHIEGGIAKGKNVNALNGTATIKDDSFIGVFSINGKNDYYDVLNRVDLESMTNIIPLYTYYIQHKGTTHNTNLKIRVALKAAGVNIKI